MPGIITSSCVRHMGQCKVRDIVELIQRSKAGVCAEEVVRKE